MGLKKFIFLQTWLRPADIHRVKVMALYNSGAKFVEVVINIVTTVDFESLRLYTNFGLVYHAYSDYWFSWFPSVPPGKYRDSTFTYAKTRSF
jgi:hypothetical protein